MLRIRHRHVSPAHRRLAGEQLHVRILCSDALEQALYARQPERDSSLVHHSDRDSQYVSIHDSERLP